MSTWPPSPQPAPRSRREWAEAAKRASFMHLAGELKVDDDGGFNWMLLTIGPRFYVRRLAERFAKKKGFVVTSVKRDPLPLLNPMTGEANAVFVIRMERQQ